MSAFAAPRFYRICSYDAYRRARILQGVLLNTPEPDTWSKAEPVLASFSAASLEEWKALGRVKTNQELSRSISAFVRLHPDVNALLTEVDAFMANPEAYQPSGTIPVWKLETYFGLNPDGDVELLKEIYVESEGDRDRSLDTTIRNLDVETFAQHPQRSGYFAGKMVGETGHPAMVDLYLAANVHRSNYHSMFSVLVESLAKGGHLAQLKRLVDAAPSLDMLRHILLGAIEGGQQHIVDVYLPQLPLDPSQGGVQEILEDAALGLITACIAEGQHHLYPSLASYIGTHIAVSAIIKACFAGIGVCNSKEAVAKFLAKKAPTLEHWKVILVYGAQSSNKLNLDTFEWLLGQMPDEVFTPEIVEETCEGIDGYSGLVEALIQARVARI